VGEPGVGFVLGLPRSGTTLLEQMLDGHPSVCGLGEFQGLTLLSRELGEQGQALPSSSASAASAAPPWAGSTASQPSALPMGRPPGSWTSH
jgi:hypothetical protein